MRERRLSMESSPAAGGNTSGKLLSSAAYLGALNSLTSGTWLVDLANFLAPVFRSSRAGVALALAGVTLQPVAAVATATEPQAPIGLSMEQALALAQRRSTQVQRSRINAEIAALRVSNARAGYYPSARVDVTANQSAAGGAFRSGDVVFDRNFEGDFRGGATLSVDLPVDISGMIGRQVEQARIDEEITSALLHDAEREAIADVHIAYLTALRAQSEVEAGRQVLGAIEDLLARAHAELPSVVPFLSLELAQARQALSGSLTAAETSKDGLKQALALPLDLRLELTSALAPPARYPELDAQLGVPSGRTDLLVARQRVRQAELAAVQAADPRRPSVSAGAYLSQYFGGRFVSDTGEESTRDYGLNLSLRLPLFTYDAGRSDNVVRIAQFQAEQARADLLDQQRRAELGVRQSRSIYDRAMERLEALPDPAAACDALRLAEASLLRAPPETAAGLLAQVSNARTAWRAALIARADAWAEAAIAAIRLRRAFGS
jgi:outer membrane protein TolC